MMTHLTHTFRGLIFGALAVLLSLACTRPARADAVVTECTQAAVENALKLGGIITLQCDGTIVLTNSLVITSNTTLNATGHRVVFSSPGGTNVTNFVRLFTVDPAATVTIRFINLILANGLSTNGGALYLGSNVNFFATSCIFSNNFALGIDGLSGTSARTNTTIGTAGDGRDGTSGNRAAGGAIYNLGIAQFDRCVFLTNGVFGGNGGHGGDGGSGTVGAGNGGAAGRGGFSYGGAIYNGRVLTATNCTFNSNFAVGGNGGEGGAAGSGPVAGYNGRGGSGGAGAGAAVFNNRNSKSTLVNSTFALNGAAGGASADAGSNRGTGRRGGDGPASAGGGVANYGTNLLINCTFFGNVATGGSAGAGAGGNVGGGRGGNGGTAWGGNVFNGGKAKNSRSETIAINCTFSDGGTVPGTNGPAGSGPVAGRSGSRGVSRGANLANSNGVVCLTNCIIAYPNPGANAFGKFKSPWFNLLSDRSIKFPKNSGNLTNTDPKLDIPRNNGGLVQTIALLEGSPAINRGTNNVGPTTDARGVGRPRNGTNDMGAYEYGVFLRAPTIVVNPVNMQVQLSNNVSFTVLAEGDPPFVYQWRRNGTAIAGGTSATLLITNAQTSSAGSYDVIVSNNSGSVESGDASLTVVIPARITQQPTNLSLSLGATATFTVTAVGDGTLAYQWTFNGVPIQGATLGTLTLHDVQPEQSGVYRVIVTNPYRSVTSIGASLIVSSIPPTITESPSSLRIISGQTATFTASASGTLPFRFLWYFNGTNLIDDPLFYSSTASLVLDNVQPESAGLYHVVITNFAGSATSAAATLTVRLVAPVITLEPESQTAVTNDSVSFSVGVAGSTPMFFQWYFDGTNLLDDATNSVLEIPSVQLTNAGTYHVLIVNTAGTTSSAFASLSVTDAPPTIIVQPAHTYALRGEDASFSVITRGTRPFSYQWYASGEVITNATNATLTISDIEFEDTEIEYTVDVTNSLGSVTSDAAMLVMLEPFEIDCDSPNCTISIDEASGELYYTLQFLSTEADEWIGIETMFTEDEEGGPIEFIHTPDPFVSDESFYRVVVTSSQPDDQPFISGDPGDLVVLQGQNATFTVDADSSTPLSYRWYFNGTNLLADATGSSLTVSNAQSIDAGTYNAVVFGILGTATSAVATLTVQTDPLAIITQPASTNVFSGETATFTAAVAGSEPLHYQWYFNNNPLLTATGPVLTIVNAQAGNAGNYQLVVTNAFGVATSATVTLGVSDSAPIIVVQPTDTEGNLGDNVLFEVTAVGSKPLTYQWYHYGVSLNSGTPTIISTNLLVNATNSTLILNNLVAFNEGIYQVAVTNTIGGTISQEAVLAIGDN